MFDKVMKNGWTLDKLDKDRLPCPLAFCSLKIWMAILFQCCHPFLSIYILTPRTAMLKHI